MGGVISNTAEIKSNINIVKNRAQRIGRSCNILIIGDQHHGKSSFINTIFRIVLSIDQSSHFQPAPAGTSSDRCTMHYKKYTVLEDHVAIFDTPGVVFDSDAKINILKKLIQGVKENFLLFDKQLENQPTLMYESILRNLNLKENESLKNKIDFVIFVATPESFFTLQQSFFSNYYTINDAKLQTLRSIVNVLKLEMDDYPYVVFTHKDESTSKRDYKDLVKTVSAYSINARTQTFLITNYNDRDAKPINETDADVYCIFAQIVFSMNK